MNYKYYIMILSLIMLYLWEKMQISILTYKHEYSKYKDAGKNVKIVY